MSLDPTPHEPHSDAADAPDAPGRVPPGTEQVYYEGSPKLRGELGTVALWSVIGLLLGAGPILLKIWGYEVGYVVMIVGVIVGLACLCVPALLVRRNYYKITNYRIDYEHGLLFKKMDTLELWHVEDVSLSQSPIDRIFRVGNIQITSGDATNPHLMLQSVHDPRPLFETIKQRIIAVKRQRGVVKLDI